MGVNKIVMNKATGEETLIDLTNDTVTPSSLARGYTAHDASGEVIEGTMPTTTVLYTEQTLTDEQKAQARENIGAVQSWNDLTDKPFGELTEGVLYETNAPAFELFGEDIYGFSAPLDVEVSEGSALSITLDDQTYSCVVANTVMGLATGNLSLFGLGEDTGEPFLMAFENGGFTIISMLAPTTLFRIVGQTYTKLSPFFIPDEVKPVQPDWNQNDTLAKDFVKNRPFYEIEKYTTKDANLTFTQDNLNSSVYGGMSVSNLFSKKGQKVTVTWDGVDYPCEVGVLPLSDGLYIGNMSIWNSQYEDTGEPFYINRVGDYRFSIYTLSTETKHTLSVLAVIDYTIDEKFIPDGVKLQPDWSQKDRSAKDFVKNKPFFFEPVTWFDIPTLSSLSATHGVAAVDLKNEYLLSETSTYTITLNGTTYERVPYTFEALTALKKDFAIGNKILVYMLYTRLTKEQLIEQGHLTADDDTGENFCILTTKSGGFSLYVAESDISGAFSFYGDALKRVDDKFIDFKPSDWNQEDETAKDFIKNKPFGESFGDTLTWDGDTTGSEVFAENYCKVSDIVPTQEELSAGGTLIAGEDTLEFTIDGVVAEDGMLYIAYGSTPMVMFVDDALSVNLGCSRGTYFFCHPGAGFVARLTINGYNGFPMVQKIDEKFLPDDVANPSCIELFYDNSLYLYNQSNRNDTSKRITKAQLLEFVKSGKVIYINSGIEYYSVSKISYSNDYAVLTGSAGTYYTAEYTGS